MIFPVKGAWWPSQNNESQPSPALKLSQMIHGTIVAQLIYVVAKLGIADLLRERPKDCSELAKTANVQPATLFRVLRALASFGIFVELEDGRFGLTPMAECLESEAEGSLRAWAILWGERFWWRPYGELLQSVRTGGIAFDHVYDMSFFEYLRQDSEAARIFHEAMSNQTTQDTSAIVSAYDFSGANKVADVGGGRGSLLAAILKANPDARGLLFDLGVNPFG